MIVCLCNGLREADVAEGARMHGPMRPQALYQEMGCKMDCGLCCDQARGVIERVHPPVYPAE